MKSSSNYWLVNPWKDSLLILAPAFIPVFVVFIFNSYFTTHEEVSPAWWLVLVLMIDVSHVYSTLFRFYWEKNTFKKYKSLLLIIPAAAFVVGVIIYSFNDFLFWRILAYLAVYHFIRQQYGFVRLYSRLEKRPIVNKWIDTVSIYNATLFPILYWHFHLTKSLSWFIPRDFIHIPVGNSLPFFYGLYVSLMVIYTIKEIYFSLKESNFNFAKNGMMAGTYLSWYLGIIYFHGDLTFTLMNVVAHGIPYMGLVWIYGEKKATRPFSFTWKGLMIFLVTLLALAYLEESIWDVLVWKDHPSLFPFFTNFQSLTNPILLSLLVPLLVLPQITHYVLDGFIWRFSKDQAARIEQ